MVRRVLTDEEIRASIPVARARGVRAAHIEPRAVEAHYDAGSERVLVELDDGCLFGFPRERYAELAGADPALLAAVTVEQDGEALHWEALDADVSVPGLVARSLKLREWAPRLLGQITTEAKARASRENGRKGGRPRNRATG